MAIKILALDGLTDTKLCGLVERLLITIPGIESATFDFFSQKLALSVSGANQEETIEEAIKTVRQYLPNIKIGLAEVGAFQAAEKASRGGDRVSQEELPEEEQAVCLSISDRLTLIFAGVALVAAVVSTLFEPGDTAGFIFACLGLCFALEVNVLLDSAPHSNPALLHYSFLATNSFLFFAGMRTSAIFSLLLYFGVVTLLRRAATWVDETARASIAIDGDYVVLTPSLQKIVTPADQLAAGDFVMLSAGDTIPCNGVICAGEATLLRRFSSPSESAQVTEDDPLMCGDQILSGKLTFCVDTPQSLSCVAYIRDRALRSSLSDTVFSIGAKSWDFAALMLLIGLAVFLPFLFSQSTWGSGRAILIAHLLIVAFFPAMLSSAIIPLQRQGLAGVLRLGCLPGSSRLLHQLNQVKTAILGFTGLLTEGLFEVEEVELFSEMKPEEFFAIVAALEGRNSHPIAAAILEECENRLGGPPPPGPLFHYENIPGYGVRATYGNHMVMIGSERMMNDMGIETPLNLDGRHRVHVSIRNELVGMFTLSDPLREDAAALVRALQHQHHASVCLLSHCDDAVTQSATVSLGADSFFSTASFSERQQHIAQLINGKQNTALLVGLPDEMQKLDGDCLRVELGTLIEGRFPSSNELLIASPSLAVLHQVLRVSQRINRLWGGLLLLLLLGKAVLLVLVLQLQLPLWCTAVACAALSLLVGLLSCLPVPTPQG